MFVVFFSAYYVTVFNSFLLLIYELIVKLRRKRLSS